MIHPWVVLKTAFETVGPLDEAFGPTEWDEADLAYRLRAQGWRVATTGYERLNLEQDLRNGQLFHQRWDATITAEHPRRRRSWTRKATPAGWVATMTQMARYARGRRE